jgi:rSAM/selenodomain-associated transferase 1
MATARVDPALELGQVQIAIFAKAPVPGLAKTRLIPALGAQGAARLQRQFTIRTLRTALASGIGPVTLWCTPDAGHRFFRVLHRTTGVPCRVQPEGDLGARMHAAFAHHCSAGPLLLIGTDCPPLTLDHLRQAARELLASADAVFLPAEDGGYVLVGLRQPQPALFEHMVWSTASVMADTRQRAQAAGLRLHEGEMLWDLDVPADLARLPAGYVAKLRAGRQATP